LYPARALSPIFQNVFWPAFSSPWPFDYDTIFTTAFAASLGNRNRDDCQQSIDANAIVERLRGEIGPSAEQIEPGPVATSKRVAPGRTCAALRRGLIASAVTGEKKS
jgi:hypothetical protein